MERGTLLNAVFIKIIKIRTIAKKKLLEKKQDSIMKSQAVFLKCF